METKLHRLEAAVEYLKNREDTIALALGHASAHATTSIYIERSLRKVDEANRRVLDAVK